ncbi:MAG: hypothetical protein CISAcid_18440 [uncultured Acidilobus sp. CIS]|nr:MAG: hypothetical protein CISAcid_18440 [uncultured Acidilobus sp. CIS]
MSVSRAATYTVAYTVACWLVIDVAQEAEVVEKELKELPEEGYILYILRVRRPKGLGTLSIQTSPGNAGSTAVSEGEEIRIRLAKVSVRFERPADIKLSLNAEAPSFSVLRQLQLVPVGVSFNSVSPISLKVDESVPVNVVPSAKISLQPVTVSFSRPSAVSLQLDSNYHVPQRTTYELKPVSVTFAQPGRASLGNVSDEVRGLGVTPVSSTKSVTESATESAAAQFAPPPPSILSKSATTPAAAPSPHELSEGEIEEVENAVDSALFGLGRLVPDRPLLIVAEHVKGFGYIEFLKRVLREVYRVRVGGLPEPKHVSNVADLQLLIPVEVGAGGRIFVIDLVSGDLGRLLKEGDVKGSSQASLRERIRDRLRELFSQGYGFIVIYGDYHIDNHVSGAQAEALREGVLKNYLLTTWKQISPETSKKSLYVLLANLMWGRVGEPEMDYKGNFDRFVVELEDEYWKALEGALKDFNIQVLVRPSAEGDEAGRESMSHYLIKAFMVNYLVRRLTEEFKGKGAKEDEARRRALGCVSTENQPSGANVRFDVYVKDKDANSDCGSMSNLVVEVETLYGTGTALHKVLDTIESRVNAGADRLWVVVPNPQAVIYLPQLLRLERYVRKLKRFEGKEIEFYTLDVKGGAPVRLVEVARRLLDEWRKLKGEPAGGAEEGVTPAQ